MLVSILLLYIIYIFIIIYYLYFYIIIYYIIVVIFFILSQISSDHVNLQLFFEHGNFSPFNSQASKMPDLNLH